MVEREGKSLGLRIAAGLAVAAAGAATMYGRSGRNQASQQGGLEERSGRGTPNGGPDAASRESGYELRDANVDTLVKVILVSLALMVGSVALVFFMFSRFDKSFQAPNAALTAEQRAPLMPPLPHLQAEPYRDIDAVLMEQTRRLTTYGWNGSDHKSGHIPIERAIQQVIGKPLDGPAQADAKGPPGSTAPQPATPAFSADLPQRKPANRVQGEGHPTAVAPTIGEPLPSQLASPEQKP